MSAITPRCCKTFLCVLLLFGCSKKQLVSESGIIDRGDYYRGEKTETIPKVAIVGLISKIADTAINQSWSKQTWVIRFGQPSRIETANGDVQILEYREDGPYQPPIARYFLSGVHIKLVNDKTVGVSYTHTTLE